MPNLFDQFDGPEPQRAAVSSGGNLFDQFDGPEQVPQAMPTDLDQGAIPQPGATPNSATAQERTGDSLRPYFGGRNPIAEAYDGFIAPLVEEPTEERRAELDERGIAERVTDTAAFVGSVPIRMATQGKAGLGDLVGSVAPMAGQSITQAEGDFAQANREALKVMKNVGDVTIGIPALNTMGRVAPAQIPAGSKVPSGVSKANAIGLKSRGQQHVRPTDAVVLARQQLLKDFEGSDVTPFGPAFVKEGTRAAAHTIGKQPFIGDPIANAARNTFSEARDSVRRLADRYGGSQTYDDAGRASERALERFKSERVIPKSDIADMPYSDVARIARQPDNMSSMKTKADAMFERALRNIPEDMRQGRTKLDLPAVKGGLTETQNVVRDIARRNLRTVNSAEYERLVKEARKKGVDPESAIAQSLQKGAESYLLPVTGNSQLARIIKDIHSGKWQGPLQSMRDVRSDIRRLASGMADTERNSMSKADITRIQRAVTRDIAGMLERNADKYAKLGEAKTAFRMRRSAKLYRDADRYYAGAVQRMEDAQRLFNAKTAEQLSLRIKNAARGQARGDLEMLRSLKSMLRPDEMDDVASGVLREMGTPRGSAMRNTTGEIEFSVGTFMTNWHNMTPQARQLLFQSKQSPEAFGDLSKLVRVMQSLADFEATANTSRSFTNMAATLILTGGAGQVIGMPITTMMTLLGARGVSKFLTTPAYVRWATKSAQLEQRYSRSRSPAMARQLQKHWAKLRPLLNDDPATAADMARVLAIATGQAGQQGTEQ